MAEIVAAFLNVIGSNITPPSTMQEIIPYLVTIFISVVLVSGVFRLMLGIVESVMTMRRM